MALGDFMASRFSQSPAVATVSNHFDDCSIADDVDLVAYQTTESTDRGRDLDSETASSSYGNGVTATATSMAYFPQTIVLCDLGHEAFEVCVPSGPADSGLVSKWQPQDQMKTECVALVLCLNISSSPPDVIKISPCAKMECWIDGRS